ncbi:MAG: class I SAM-dependent methyltransferase [Bdellovibrionales bacterium]|nr:class I SAM-dependent methyltransferase [Bdellovibrionales bacterium]
MKTSLLLGLLVLGACASKQPEKAKPVIPQTIAEAVASNYRTEENTKRDIYRHPFETLAFFGLKPEMNVVEIAPGAGWYMEIIAPLVSQKGKYTMAIPTLNPEKAYQVTNDKLIKDWMAAHPEVSANMSIATYDLPAKSELGPEKSADLVVTFRNVHNWMTLKAEKEAFKSFFKVLKPGGVLGVVEHRELPNKYDPLAKSGYVREKDVVRMATRAGFKLVAKSEINANSKDTKNHPEGVWTLPPGLRLGDKDKEKYLAIGESDRMTLKFIKPVK